MIIVGRMYTNLNISIPRVLYKVITGSNNSIVGYLVLACWNT